MRGPDDVDWYVYKGTDAGGFVDPKRRFDASLSVEVCAFFACEKPSDKAVFSCPADATAATPVLGMPGCCAGRSFGVSLDCLPSGGLLGADNARVFMRVRRAAGTRGAAATCQPYELQYHY